MSSRRSSGFTLLEVLLASAIGVMLLGVVYQIVSYSRAAGSTAQQSYILGQDAAAAFRTVQRELTDTSLTSLVIDTWKSPVGDLPRFSLLSAREEGGLRIGPDGVPHWLREVQYRLEPSPQEPDTGVLVRRERALLPGTLPFPQPVRSDLSAEQGRPILRNVLLPGRVVRPGKTGLAEVQPEKDAPGGWQLRFVRRDPVSRAETLTVQNPGSRSDAQEQGWTQSTTGLLRLSIGILERDASTGQVGYMELRLAVTPSHD